MIDRQKHYFPVNDCYVTTGWIPQVAQYGAYREQDAGEVRGWGATRLEAIADLVERVGPIEEVL